jgi:orotate phosphoribosyltransferase
MPFDRQALIDLFRQRALLFGDFTLASGKKAKYFLDGKQITLHSHGLKLISEGLWELLREREIDAIGGMSLGADPIVAGILCAAAAEGRDLIGFLVRKETKDHGTRKFIEGPLKPGMRVAIVEDVVTTGGSSLLAIERVLEFGGQVSCVAAIVDRMEGGRAAFESRGYKFDALLTIQDFGITPPESRG